VNLNRNAFLACIAALMATCGDLLVLLVVNSQRTGVTIQQSSIMLTFGGLFGCLSMPFYAFGYAAVARLLRPTARIAAAIILFGGIAFAIVCPLIHGLMWMAIRSQIATNALSSSDPMAAVAAQGGIVLDLWIMGVVLATVISISIVRAGIVRPRLIPLWFACLNPITLVLVIGMVGSFEAVGRSYILPMAPNLAHIGFFVALSWYLHSSKMQQSKVASSVQ